MTARRKATPGHQLTRTYLSLSRWTAALIGIAAVVRVGAGVMSFFTVGPLLGLAIHPLWDSFGGEPIVVEWLFAALLVIAGIATAIRIRTNRIHRRALVVGWFMVIDTVLYVVPIVVVLVTELEVADDLWWMTGAAVVMANALLVAMGLAVIRKASWIHRIRRRLLPGHHIRKPRLVRTSIAS
jgi:hypothetical protein